MEKNRIYNMDCVEGMRCLEDKSVDMTVTSPPYDNLRNYNGFEWDFKETAKELYRVTKDGGVVVWIIGDATIKGSESGTSFRQALYFMEVGFRLHDTMIWKKDTMSFPDKTRYGQNFEYMFVFSRGKPKTIHKIKDRKNKYVGAKIHGTSRKADGSTFRKANHNKNVVSEYGERFNVWEIPTEKKNKTGHPAVFPEQIANDHILSWSNPGDLILDPFLGSGTTAKMAILNGRNFIGFDLSKEYCEAAEKRIKDLPDIHEAII